MAELERFLQDENNSLKELKELTKNVNLFYDKIFKPLYNFSGSNRKPQCIERKVL